MSITQHLKLNEMGIRLKFNLVLSLVFLLGLGVAGLSSFALLHRNATAEAVRNARLLMEAALAIRGYTVHHVRPHLEAELKRVFLPQVVPAFAATQTLNELRKKYPDYGYKEATLNPTNPRNRTVDWEADLVTTFRNSNSTTEIIGERGTPTGDSLYIARPIRIVDPACLACHNTPGQAPASMVKVYGPSNGFGWKMNEVIGAQIVSVPTTLPMKNANRAFLTFMASLVAVFALVFAALNLMLNALILRPIQAMARAADAVSTGDFTVGEVAAKGKDEIAILGASFNRMRRSLQKAMQMLEE
jgi:HAMP domain-containing protein